MTHPVQAAPGSARAKVAEFTAAAASLPLPQPAAVPDMQPVPVTGTPRVANADDATYRTVTLDTSNPYRLVLPMDPQRYRAVVMGSSDKVYICATQEAAQEVAINGSTSDGAQLAASVPVTLRNKGQCWAANSTPGTSATIAVVVERYEYPEP